MSSSVSELLSSPVSAREFSPEDVLFFQEQGFVVARGLVNSVWLDRMRLVTREHLERELPPVEFEAEVHYPGAPDSLDAPGGRTVRRLKQALTRDIVFTEWVCQLDIVRRLEQLLGGRVVMPLAHHNCIMTKQPKHSSETGWHQDVRYWNFARPDLVSVWLALGTERPENGCLWVIPGSHRVAMERSQLDAALFFRKDHPENQTLLDAAIPVELAPGENIQTIGVSDSSAWQIAPGKRGDFFFVKNVSASGMTNMTVVTSARVYNFELAPSGGYGETGAYHVRVVYPAPPPGPATADTEPSFEYRLSGAKAIRPASVYQEGTRTIIEWPEDAALPGIFMIENGHEALINGEMQDGRFVIPGSPEKLIFRLDRKTAYATRKALKVAENE